MHTLTLNTLNYDNVSVARIKNQIKQLDKYSNRRRVIYTDCLRPILRHIVSIYTNIYQAFKNSIFFFITSRNVISSIDSRDSPDFDLAGKRIRHMVFYLSLDVPWRSVEHSTAERQRCFEERGPFIWRVLYN